MVLQRFNDGRNESAPVQHVAGVFDEKWCNSGVSSCEGYGKRDTSDECLVFIDVSNPRRKIVVVDCAVVQGRADAPWIIIASIASFDG
jgi:hypothetical protein